MSGGMRPRKISDEEILTITRNCVLEHGPQVSTLLIAEQLNVSQATLFKRFGSKIELIRRALFLPLEAHRMVCGLEEPVDTSSPHQQLIDHGHLLLAFFEHMVPCVSMLHSAGIPFSPPQGEESLPVRVGKAMESWVMALQDSGDVRPTVNQEAFALSFIGAMQHRSFRRHLLKVTQFQLDDEAYVRSVVDMYWTGIACTV